MDFSLLIDATKSSECKQLSSKHKSIHFVEMSAFLSPFVFESVESAGCFHIVVTTYNQVS